MEKNQQNFLYILSIRHAKLHMDRHNLLRFCSVPHFIFGKKIVFTSGQTDYQYRVFVRYFILKLASFFTAKFSSPVLV